MLLLQNIASSNITLFEFVLMGEPEGRFPVELFLKFKSINYQNH